MPTDAGRRTPVISLTLIADESVHVATISEAARADSAIPARAAGIDSSRVDLRIVDDSGAVRPLLPDSVPGRYSVFVVARRGARYRLEGSIDGTAVFAETVVPTTFTINQPVRDTITTADATPCGTFLFPRFCVPYVFEFDGPAAFAYVVFSPNGLGEFGTTLRSYQGQLLFLPSDSVRAVAFLAYNEAAAEWLLRETPRSNISGAFGGFGAALVTRRNVFIP